MRSSCYWKYTLTLTNHKWCQRFSKDASHNICTRFLCDYVINSRIYSWLFFPYFQGLFFISTGEIARLSQYQWRRSSLNKPQQTANNGRDGVSNHQPHHCLLNRLFSRRSKETSRLRWPVNSPHTGPVTRKNVSIWWRHHDPRDFQEFLQLITNHIIWDLKI